MRVWNLSTEYKAIDPSRPYLFLIAQDPNGFDLVPTDMTMPRMTGIQLSEKIMAVRRDMPIIICTGFSEKIDQEKAHAVGIKGLLMKPIPKSDLARMIRKVLDAATP